MNAQRFIVVLLAVIGMIATFLPWYDVTSSEVITGLSSSGWFTFIMFFTVLFLVTRKNWKEDMPAAMVWTVSFFSVAAAVVVLWRVMDIDFSQDAVLPLSGGQMNGVMGSEVAIRYGAWIIVVAGLSIPLLAFLFKSRKQEFDF